MQGINGPVHFKQPILDLILEPLDHLETNG